MVVVHDRLLTLPTVADVLAAPEPLVADIIGRGELLALEIAPGEFRVALGDLRRFIAFKRASFRPAVVND
jgi:hypothetical protein